VTAIEPHTVTTPWDILNRQAAVLAESAIVPARYQGHPEDIIAAGLMGHEVGWGVMTSLQLIHVVEGKPEISAEGMVALVRRAGHSMTGEVSPEAATVRGKRGDNGDEMDYSFTQSDAKRADLAGKTNWRRYPSSMLWARAVSQLCRMLFPDVLLGMSYVAGEISGADFDLGEPIVPPPAGVVDVAGHQVLMSGPTIYPSDSEVADLLALAKALTEEQRAAVKAEGARLARPGKYSWSFLPEHRWTVPELRDATAFIQGLAGAEPWEDGEQAPELATGGVVSNPVVLTEDPPYHAWPPGPPANEDGEPIDAEVVEEENPPLAALADLYAAGRAAGLWDGKTGHGVVRKRLLAAAAEHCGATYATPEELAADPDAVELLLAKLTPVAE
jgi:hypothetical protein